MNLLIERTLHHFFNFIANPFASNFCDQSFLIAVLCEKLIKKYQEFGYLNDWVFYCTFEVWDDIESESASKSNTAEDSQRVILKGVLWRHRRTDYAHAQIIQSLAR